MTEHTCGWSLAVSACDAPAHFKVGIEDGLPGVWWLCAEHYDQYVTSKTRQPE